jgi:hypothetical protein
MRCNFYDELDSLADDVEFNRLPEDEDDGPDPDEDWDDEENPDEFEEGDADEE